jgi:hypothetical protein
MDGILKLPRCLVQVRASRGISMLLIAIWRAIFRILFHLLLVDVLDGKKGKVWGSRFGLNSETFTQVNTKVI